MKPRYPQWHQGSGPAELLVVEAGPGEMRPPQVICRVAPELVPASPASWAGKRTRRVSTSRAVSHRAAQK